MKTKLEILCDALERERALFEPAGLRARLDALDRLEGYLLDGPGSPEEAPAQERARALASQFETLNRARYQSIRQEIQRGAGRAALLEWALDADVAAGDGYDSCDALVSGVLQFEPPGAETIELAPEMVFYQPTPARHVLDLIRRAELTAQDVLVDLGSGLGHVPLLASICTDATSVGVEIERAYVACATRCAAALHLPRVVFLPQDARAVDFTRGTVFYLYTPFVGTILRTVLDALRREASRRVIRIGTFGPCTATVAREPWLEAVGGVRPGRAALFRAIEPMAGSPD